MFSYHYHQLSGWVTCSANTLENCVVETTNLVVIAGRSQEYFTSTHGERAAVVRHKDNLSLEGSHSMKVRGQGQGNAYS